MPPFRILVTGATGFLGPWLVEELRRRGASVLTAGRSGGDLRIDLTAGDVRREALAAAAPSLVVNLAAMSQMDACERDPGRARAVNADLPGALAQEFGHRLLHVSTDLVFDGCASPYLPDSSTGPLSAYGTSKAEGEERVLAHGGRVARVPLLFGPDDHGRGASGMLRRALAEERGVCLFTNEYRTPLHVADAAAGLCETLLACASHLVHLPGPERVSRWEFGRRFCALHRLPCERLQPGECTDAKRPRDVSLAGEWQAARSLDAMLLDA
jgi:dTDP-4-dehydrorhamnose reductase